MQGSLNDLSPHTHTHLTMDNTDAAKSSTLPPLSLPWRTRLALSLLTTVTDACTRTNGTINRRILGFFSLRSPPNPTPIKGVKSSDVTVDPSRDLWFRIFTPTNSTPTPSTDPLPVIIFFHGGGFVHLSADSSIYDAVCRRFARTAHAVVVSVNYRLAPEHRYPAQYQDGFDVLKFLDEDESVRKLLPENADLSRCFLAGDSAGGNLSHNVAVKACQSKFQQLKVIGVVAIQPFFGGEERTEAEKRLVGAPLTSMKRTDWVWRAFLPPGEGLDRDHEAINVSGPNAIDLSSLEFPATLVIVAGYDALQDWQRRYYEWLKRAGKEVYLIEYPNMFHAFYIFPEVPESAKLITEVANFVHKCLKAQGGGGS